MDLGSQTWTIDIDCSGRMALLSAVKDSTGTYSWKVFKFGPKSWDEITLDVFKLPFRADIDPEAIRILPVDGSACPAIVVATAQGGGLHATYQASPTGWRPLPSKTPPFDLVDAGGLYTGAIVANVTSSTMADVFTNRVQASGRVDKFFYSQTTSGWTKAPDTYEIPILSDLAHTSTPSASVADFDGDGKADIVLPSNSRGAFGRIFLASTNGFAEQLAYVPPVAFARKDNQDLGTRLVDLDGDGLPDLLVSRSGGTPAAFRNTGSGWSPQAALVPSVPFTGDDISGNPVQFVDVDGDGYVDLLYSYRDKNGTVTKLYRNTDSGNGTRKWVEVTAGSPWFGLIPPSDCPFAAEKLGDLGVRFLDVKGTGRPYMLCGFLPAGAGATPKLMAFRNDGTSWIQAPEYAPPVPFVAQIGTSTDPTHDLSVQTIDVNADGLPDIIAKYHDPTNPSTVIEGVWLNNGQGWVKDASITIPVSLDNLTWDPQQGLKWEKNASILWADVNGDGLQDILYIRREGNNNSSITYLGTGKGWIASESWKVPIDALADRGGDSGLRVIDHNGDGYPDLLYLRQDADGVKKGTYIRKRTASPVSGGQQPSVRG